MKPKRKGLERRIPVVKNCGRREVQNLNQVNCQIAEYIAEIAESQKVVLEKFAEIAESHKVLVGKIDFIHDQLVAKISIEGHAKRIASNLIEWKRKSPMTSPPGDEWPPHVPTNNRIPQTPPNPLVSQLPEKRMKEMGMSSQICGRCAGWFRHAAVSKLCGECHRQNCESAATFFASATLATPAEFVPSLKPYGLREHFDCAPPTNGPPSLHPPSWAPVVTTPRPPPPT